MDFIHEKESQLVAFLVVGNSYFHLLLRFPSFLISFFFISIVANINATADANPLTGPDAIDLRDYPCLCEHVNVEI